jgi:hypothetical protein
LPQDASDLALLKRRIIDLRAALAPKAASGE